MSLLGKYFRKNRKSKEQREFLDIHFSEIDNHGHSLQKIQDGRLDYIIIRNVLEEVETERIIEKFQAVKPEETRKDIEGLSVYPPNFRFSDSEAKSAATHFKNIFDIDVVNRAKNIFERISAQEVNTFAVEDNKVCNALTVREMEAKFIGLTPHCENLFHNTYADYYAQLSKIATTKNHLSYFFMLAPSELGGELTLFDFEWEQVKQKLKEEAVEDSKGNRLDLTDDRYIRHNKIAPGVGDLLIFSGGQRWHRIESIEGSRPRYTLGGFLTKAQKDASFIMWA